MKLPVIQGIIRRRILVNFRVDPAIIQPRLPSGFQPKLHAGQAIAGICLIRLEEIRPRFLPAPLGVTSENAAHRIAVLWHDGSGNRREGVFIPRRDTSSYLNHLAGGRVFPGEHHKADFTVRDTSDAVDIRMNSKDGDLTLKVRGRVADRLPDSSSFSTLEEASAFFEPGSLGYSVTTDPGRLDGISLKTKTWKVEPLEVDELYSSYFSDPSRFPPGSVAFDCALVMRDIEHEWHGADDLYV
jgi:Uncharacterized conserved protein (COG2071)